MLPAVLCVLSISEPMADTTDYVAKSRKVIVGGRGNLTWFDKVNIVWYEYMSDQ
jgi:hypothetical protein